MHGWKTVSLGDVCVIEKTKYKDGELPYVGMEDIVSGTGKFVGSREPKKVGSSTFHFTPEHLLYGRLRPYLNKVLLPDFEGHCSSEIFPLLPKSELDKSFLFYWITSEQVVKEINRTCTGARMPRANVNEVLKFDIPIPPIDEQKCIVAILDEAFAGIDTAIANTEKNLANARELFESYLNSVFSERGEDWEETTLGDSCEFYNGKAHEKCINESGKFVVVNSKFISSDGAVFKMTDNQLFALLTKDIAMVMSDVPKGKALAKCFLVDVDKKYTLNQRICCIRSSNFVTKYLYYHLNRHPYLLSFDNGENQTNLRKNDILKCPLLMPSEEEQSDIVSRLDSMGEGTQQLAAIYQQKLNSLKELKQSLLQKAFSGELTAKPDKLIDEAVA
ncbi:restriction endonuclease subunit S [Methylotuvimicrobium buryatense]|uniref:Restriction endonuclease subunit S n=1 Tax=Methylotuvimicrobium buryatense TaxID=95641 RepID=A0A4P9UPQ7_METBY|nr:restriction endonuclease subunit S [Methylotuvimicrobium buryatense]QCW82221.1 restriction endonuclease subunit S [Methylotuvimicrobium buryatense]